MHTILVVETFTAQDREYSVNIFHKFLSLFISQPHVLLSMRWRCNSFTKKKKDERDKNLLNRIDQIYRRENIRPNHQKRLTLCWFRKKISVSTRTTKVLQIASEKIRSLCFFVFFQRNWEANDVWDKNERLNQSINSPPIFREVMSLFKGLCRNYWNVRTGGLNETLEKF